MNGQTGAEFAAAVRARLTAELEVLTPEQLRAYFRAWTARCLDEVDPYPENPTPPRSKDEVLAHLRYRIEQCEELIVLKKFYARMMAESKARA